MLVMSVSGCERWVVCCQCCFVLMSAGLLLVNKMVIAGCIILFGWLVVVVFVNFYYLLSVAGCY